MSNPHPGKAASARPSTMLRQCHEKAFLLKFARDRRRYLRWLFEARKRFGLCVLNYVVTANHVHLLVRAGVVNHPAEWAHGGYREIQDPPSVTR